MVDVEPDVVGVPTIPILRSPDDTKGWTPVLIAGREGWTDEEGVTWVRARADEVPERSVEFTQHRGLPTLHLVRAESSQDVRRAQRKARRVQRALKARGYE